MKAENITGQRFGKLVVLRYSHKIRRTGYWICVCDCNRITTVRVNALRSGNTKSCGCIRGFFNAGKPIHGHSGKHGKRSIEYKTWDNMIQRCTNENHNRYKDYGGRGIEVCERWLVFENFLADMGLKPLPSFTIERENNDGNYEFSNCIWATRSVQIHNRRLNK